MSRARRLPVSRRTSRLVTERLEDRQLLAADWPSTGFSGNLPIPHDERPTRLTFIASDLEELAASFASSSAGMGRHVVLMDPVMSPLDQITAEVTRYHHVEAIEIYSHGDAGVLVFPNETLSAATLQEHAPQLSRWRASLSSAADILLFGCNVGAGSQGSEFLANLARHTGADVAASQDLTGDPTLGGNWTLEIQTGPIAAGALRAPLDYAQVLFKPYTHVAVADEVYQDLQDGNITIPVADGEAVSVPVPAQVLRAVRNHRAFYNAGAIGPDGFPDFSMGQAVIHPEDHGYWLQHILDQAWKAQSDQNANISRPYSVTEKEQILAFAYGFLTHSAGDVWSHTLVNDFATGIFPDLFGGDLPNAEELQDALGHMFVENYIVDATPGFDGSNAVVNTTPEILLPTNGQFHGTTGGVNRFIFETMIRPQPRVNGLYSLTSSRGFAIDSLRKWQANLSRRPVTTQEAAQQIMTQFGRCLNDVLDIFDGDNDACIDFVQSFEYVSMAYEYAWYSDIDTGLAAWPELGLRITRALFDPQTTRDAQAFYCRNNSSDACRASVGMLDVLMYEVDSPSGSGQNSFLNTHLLGMAGLPDEVGQIRALVGDIKREINDALGILGALAQPLNQALDALFAPIDALANLARDKAIELLKDVVREALGVDIDQLDDLFRSPSSKLGLQQIGLNAGGVDLIVPLFASGDRERLDRYMGLIRDPNENGVNLHRQFSSTVDGLSRLPGVRFHENAVGGLLSHVQFSPDAFPAFRNSVTMSKLLLLDGAGMDQFINQVLGSGSEYAHYAQFGRLGNIMTTSLDVRSLNNRTISLPWLNSIDADHSWQETRESSTGQFEGPSGGTGQFPLYEDCRLRDRLFRQIFSDWENDIHDDRTLNRSLVFPDFSDAPSGRCSAAVVPIQLSLAPTNDEISEGDEQTLIVSHNAAWRQTAEARGAAFLQTNITSPVVADIGDLRLETGGGITYEFVYTARPSGPSITLLGASNGNRANAALKLAQFPNTNQLGVTEFGVSDRAASRTPAVFDQPTQVVFVAHFEDNSVDLYVNGEFSETLPDAAVAISGAVGIGQGFNFATNAGFDRLAGTLHGVAIYDRALDGQAIADSFALAATTYAFPIRLEYHGTAGVNGPLEVVIPAGRNSADFVVSAPEDDLFDGTHEFTVHASWATDPSIVVSSSPVLIRDDDEAQLVFQLNSPNAVTEGEATTAVVSHNLAAWDVVASGLLPTVVMTDIGSPQVVDIGNVSLETQGGITYEFIVSAELAGISAALMGSANAPKGDSAALKMNQWPSTGRFGVTEFGVVDFVADTPAAAGVPTHVVFVAKGTDMELYIDGIYRETLADAAVTIAGPTGIGYAYNHDTGGSVDTLDGRILGMAVYDRALSASTIYTNYLSSLTTHPMSVAIRLSDPAQAIAPSRVIIPPGERSANVPISTVDFPFVDGDRNLTVTATSSGFADPSLSLRILDDDVEVPAEPLFAIPLQPFHDPGPGLHHDAELVDVNGDGSLDAIFTGANSVQVWLNNGIGGFRMVQETSAITDLFYVAPGDVDGDGDVDLVLATRHANRVLLNNGTGSFADSLQELGDGFSIDLALGDLDGDQDLDLFVANFQGPNRIWLNQGDGVFRDSGLALGNESSKSVELVDIDHDGDLDAIVANQSPTADGSLQARLYRNDSGKGALRFTEQIISNSRNTQHIAVADLNGDTHVDLFLAGAGPNEVWFGRGDGTFHDSRQRLGNSASSHVVLEDFDGDGDLDALIANWNQPDTLWINGGRGFFGLHSTYEDTTSSHFAVGDIDRDGDVDAILANYGQPNVIFESILQFEELPHADLNQDSQLDEGDIDFYCRALAGGLIEQGFDVNRDNFVDGEDHRYLLELLGTGPGDANFDGVFDSSDFVLAFSAGTYESGHGSGWSQGDWNCDTRFDSADFVAAFTVGWYELPQGAMLGSAATHDHGESIASKTGDDIRLRSEAGARFAQIRQRRQRSAPSENLPTAPTLAQLPRKMVPVLADIPTLPKPKRFESTPSTERSQLSPVAIDELLGEW